MNTVFQRINVDRTKGYLDDRMMLDMGLLKGLLNIGCKMGYGSLLTTHLSLTSGNLYLSLKDYNKR